MEDKFIILSKDVANQLIGYLGKKPYTEVSNLIEGILNDANANAKSYGVTDLRPNEASKPLVATEAPVEGKTES